MSDMTADATGAASAAPVRATPDERQQALNAYVTNLAAQGWRVVSQSGTNAQLVKGKPTNHILHLILTILTLGLWAIVWICMVVFGGEKTRFVTVDEQGRVTG